MRSIFRNIMGYLGVSREAEGPTGSSCAARAGEVRDERPAAGTPTPEAENTRRLREIVDRSMALGQRVAAQAEAGDVEAALESARGIGSPLFYAFALKEIAAAQVRAGCVTEAVETIRRIDDPELRAGALAHFSAIGRRPGAADAGPILDAALAAFEEMREEEEVSRGGWRTATDLAAEGDYTAAVEAARGIGDPFWRSWALQEIATAQAGAGEFTAALNTASGVGKTPYRYWAYRDITLAQAQAGQMEAAADTARRIEDPEERELALAGIERHKQDRRP